MTPLSYRLSLAALLLTVTLSFLGAHHRLPLATFYQEWLAGLLGLAALLPLAFARDDSWLIPRTILLPLMLTLLVWIQLAAGVDVLFEGAALFSLYLVWAALMMLVASHLATGIGRDALADWLAWALLAGSLLAAGTGALQHWGPSAGLPYIFPSSEIRNGEIRMSGNIAQANNFVAYLWMGVVSALHLHGRGRLACAPAWLALSMLIGLSLFSGSRNVYIDAGVVTAWCALWAWHSEGDSRRRLTISALVLLPLLSLLQALLFRQIPYYSFVLAGGATVWCAVWAWRKAGDRRRRLVLAALLLLPTLSALYIFRHGIDALLTRVRPSISSNFLDPARMALWRAAIEIFGEHPLLGAGYNSFSREFFMRVERFPISIYRENIPEHSHNLLTQMLAEFGIAGFSLTLIAAAGWLIALRLRKGNGPNHLALGILLILGIHSGLEYPLWYAYFLVIAAIALSLGDEHRWQFRNAAWHRPAMALVAIGGMLALFQLRSDYTLLEDAANGQSAAGEQLPADVQQQLLTALSSQSLLRHYALLQLAARTPIEANDIDARLRIVTSATHFSPIREAVFRQAALMQLAGQSDAAEMHLMRSMVSFPTYVPEALAQFEENPETRPALQPLIEMLRLSMAH